MVIFQARRTELLPARHAVHARCAAFPTFGALGRPISVDFISIIQYLDPVSGAEHYVAHTIVVLEGRLEVNGQIVGPVAYCHFPAGETMSHAPAESNSCLFVVIFCGPFDVQPVGE
jgi:hypothetical protein